MSSPFQLPDFLARVTAASSPSAALQATVVGLAETFDAEVVAMTDGDGVVASTGYARHGAPVEELLDAAAGRRPTVEVPGAGPAPATVIPFGAGGVEVVVVRWDDPLDAAEQAHARTMIRVASIAHELLDKITENEKLLRQEQTNQLMLEAILRVQRLISQRRDVDTILHAITAEAATLLRADLAGIWVQAPSGMARLAQSHGIHRAASRSCDLPADQLAEIGRRAAEGELLRPTTVPLDWCDQRREVRVVGAPVVEDSRTIGGLYVVMVDDNPAQSVDSAAIRTFASQASIALTDARTLDELHHAFHDTLTGLPNRALFQSRFERAVTSSNRTGSSTALLFIDLDHFKAVNDTFGHDAGDELLRDVATALLASSRRRDGVARLGGDEFAMLLEDATVPEAERVAQRVLEVIAAVENRTRPSGRCGASIGIAVTDDGRQTTDELLRQADIAMYSAKASGRSGYATYHPSMGSSRLDHKAVVAALETALDRNEFVVWYQPLVDLDSHDIVGAEALVRWHDPDRGMISPGQFIRAAEDTGLIVPIGRQVLEMACHQAAGWTGSGGAAGGRPFSLTINISGRQLQSDEILEDVAAALARSGLDPGALTLEVTESIFVDEIEHAGDRLQALKELGVGLAIDDFGTGFSSLSYFHRYPFDVLKIDRSFIRGLGTATNGEAVIETMLSLARQLNMVTVAEGIERHDELDRVQALGCDLGQGYLFSRPVAAGVFKRLLVSGVAPAVDVPDRTPAALPGDR